MKTITITMIYMLGTLCAFAAGMEDADRIERMTASMQRDGIDGLMASVRKERWTAPSIPSKWFVESRIADTEKRRQAQAARDFGRQVGIQLEEIAQEQQALLPGEILYRRTLLLCDAGEWCAGTTGYGNLFLARRCLDLAAVGLARLTASTNFPLADCKMIAARMAPPWLGMAYRQQVLNGEAGTNLFVNVKMTNEELDRQCAIGWTMRERVATPTLIAECEPPNPAFVDLNAFTNNLDFFTSDERSGNPVTLLRSWDCKEHRFVTRGLELQSVTEVLALLEFRSVVGFFPERRVRSEEEIKKRDAEIIEYAKKGITITKSEDDPNFDPLLGPFEKEWLKRPNRKASEDNRCGIALLAYRKVKSSIFFDEDSAAIYHIKQKQEMRKVRQKINN